MTASVLFVQFTNAAAYPPIMNLARLLRRRGWRTPMIGAEVASLTALTLPPELSARAVLVRRGRGAVQLQYAAFVLRALARVIGGRPRWVYASDLFSVPVAFVATFVPGVRVVFHEHDSPVERRESVDVRILLRLRRAVLARADAVVVPSEARRRLVEAALRRPRRIDVVMNTPLGEDLAHRGRRADGDLRLLFQGAVTPSRLPLTAIDALARVPDVTLTIVGYGTTDAVDHPAALAAAAARAGIAHRVRLVGPMDHAATLRLTAEHDVGIVLLSDPPNWDLNLHSLFGASNKIFEYLGTGLAVLTMRTPDLDAGVVQAGYGVAVDGDGADDIARSIEWIATHRDEVEEMGRRGQDKVRNQWNYEVSAQPVLELIGAP